jgi:hypothetical protein
MRLDTHFVEADSGTDVHSHETQNGQLPRTQILEHLGRPSFTRFGSWWSIRTRNAARGVVAVVTIADDLEAARWVVRAADWDARVYAAVSG